jgi:hypothetical protein
LIIFQKRLIALIAALMNPWRSFDLMSTLEIESWLPFGSSTTTKESFERQMKYCERQIKEFYRPLFSLIREILSAGTPISAAYRQR